MLLLMQLLRMGLEGSVGSRCFACRNRRLLLGGLQEGELLGEELLSGGGAAEAEGGLSERGLLGEHGSLLTLLL